VRPRDLSVIPHAAHGGHRRGTAYVLAVGLALLIGAVATGTLLATRARFAGEADMNDLAKATLLAESGLQYGLRQLNSDVSYASGTIPAATTSNVDLGFGRVRIKIAAGSDDGNAATLTPATITVSAAVGNAVRRYQIAAHPLHTAMGAFELPIAVGGRIGVANGASLKVAGTEGGAAGALTITGSGSVTGTVRITGLGNADADAAMQASLDRPSLLTPDHVTSLRESATTLIVSGGGSISLSGFLLAPTSNPFGNLNQRGLYVLDCAGRNVTISDCRIVGTLLLVNPGASSALSGAVVMEPAIRGYPCLVVDGNITLDASSTRLNESGTNFNPQGVPHPYFGGSVDQDMSDGYAARIYGGVAVTGRFIMQGTGSIAGLSVGGDCGIQGSLTVNRDDWASWSPAPELLAARWRPDPTSLMEVFSGP
jgi:hypothetical protein